MRRSWWATASPMAAPRSRRPTRTLPPRDRSMRRLSARRRRSKGSEDWPLPRVQPLSQRSDGFGRPGKGHHEDHCSCPIPVARGVLSHGADQQRLVVHHVRDLGRDQRRQHARHHVQFKSDASGTLRTAPAMGGQSFYGSFSSDSCMVSAGGGGSVVGFGMNVAFPIEDQKRSLRRNFERTMQAAASTGSRPLAPAGNRGHRHSVPDGRSDQGRAGGAGAVHQSRPDHG